MFHRRRPAATALSDFIRVNSYTVYYRCSAQHSPSFRLNSLTMFCSYHKLLFIQISKIVFFFFSNVSRTLGSSRPLCIGPYCSPLHYFCICLLSNPSMESILSIIIQVSRHTHDNRRFSFIAVNRPYSRCQSLKPIIIIIIILFIERHIQRAVRGAVQHSKAGVKRNN